MKLEYIIFKYSCEYKTLSKHHVSPYLILTRRELLIKKSITFPIKRLTRRRINHLTTAEESLCPAFSKVLDEKTIEDRFQKLYEILKRYTEAEDKILTLYYYHEVYSI